MGADGNRDQHENQPAGAAATAAAPGEDCERELGELTARYVRLAADFNNFRRRAAREAVERQRSALEPFLGDLLPIVDDLRRAAALAAAGDPLGGGVTMVLQRFDEVLDRHAVTPMITVGEPFDPQRHEAIMATEAPDVERETVVREVRPGYMLHGRVIQPAQVEVARPPGDSTQ